MALLPTTKDAQESISKLKALLQFLRYSPRESAAVLIASISAWLCGWLWLISEPPWLLPFISAGNWVTIRIAGFFAFGAITLVAGCWGVFKIWKQLLPPPTTAGTLPAALKGPTSFGPHDAALFEKLHRGHEIATLLSWVQDDQHGVIVVRGESGSGKTSLLRAGLYGQLATAGMTPVYWEALPSDPLRSLLRVVNEVGQAEAKTWEDLCSLGEKDKKRRVIILDQFEQLRPDHSAHQPIFSILRHVAATSAPHYVTCVVAYRREYDSVWLDFELAELHENRPRVSTLKLFSKPKAKSIFASLTEASGLNIDQELIDDLLDAMAREGDEVSPSDIGITLLSLNELANRKGVATLRKDDYVIAGGPTGLLADYINTRLERSRDDRPELLKALLALEDPNTHQRVAAGLTARQLSEKVNVPFLRLQGYLKALSGADARVLEKLDDQHGEGNEVPRYRLAHERLIPALRQLAGIVLAEVEQVRLQFNDAFQAWKTNRGQAKYLLSGKILRQVLAYRADLHSQEWKEEKQSFIEKSKQKRSTVRRAVASFVIVLILAGYFGGHAYNRARHIDDFHEWQLPVGLYDSQSQLQELLISNDKMTHVRWLKGNLNTVRLGFEASNLNSLDGINSVKNLKSLQLNGVEIEGLRPLKELKGLTSLTLELPGDAPSLDPLKELKGLTSLTLTLPGKAPSLDPLKELKGLTSLSLTLRGKAPSLDPLKELKGLTSLTLGSREIFGMVAISLEPLKELKGLTSLTLYGISVDSASLEPLKELKGLTSLTLGSREIFGMVAISLDPLKELKGLTSLSLTLRGRAPSLDPLKELKGLTSLTLQLPGNPPSLDPLKELKGLTSLTLTLPGKAPSLDPLKELQGLTSLTLQLPGNAPSLDPLNELEKLTSLTLQLSENPPSLYPLKELKSLTSLILVSGGLFGIVATPLEPLKELKGLTSLTLQLSENPPSLDPLKELKGLTSLTLQLPGNAPSLDPLNELEKLTSLTLSINSFRVVDLQHLSTLKAVKITYSRLDGLTLPNSTRELELILKR